jgi:hypothetical protein
MAFGTSAIGQITLMNPSATPSTVDTGDPNGVEVGLKFGSTTSGFITGLRFYKARTNTGTHVGHLWSSTGALLGSATFTSESASGWQQVNFSSPVPIAANTVYVASYFAPAGHVSANINYLATQGIHNPPLHALTNGMLGPNGVGLFTSSGGFPTGDYQASYFWVDVVFTTAQQPANPILTTSPTSLSFGSVALNTPTTQSVALTSSGTSPLTINSASISGAGFSIVGAALPATLNPGQSLTLQLQFKPTVSGAATGQLTISSNSTTGATSVVSLSGTGTAGANPKLSLGTTALSFGSIAVNTSTTQSVALTSSGTSPLTVNSASISGAGFSIIAGTFPATLNPGQSMTLQLQFKPAGSGAATGQLAISSNSTTGGTAVVSLSGTGAAANSQLTLSATTLAFGGVTVNTSTTNSLTLTSTGTSSLTVNSASIAGTGFTIVGGSFPATLSPNQSMTLQVQFKPTVSGSATGQLTISSNSTTGGTAVVSLSGTGTAVAHEVDLSWTAPGSSPMPIAGYNIYRSSQLINPSKVSQTTYVDKTVASGTTYTYTVTTVDTNGVESVPSTPVSVTIP